MSGAAEPGVKPSDIPCETDAAAVLLGQKCIPRDGKCVASARRFVRDVAADWNACEEAREIAELLTSELVTNALTHGGGGAGAAGGVRVEVGRDGEVMSVTVHDSGVAVPRMRSAGAMETCGRGLSIVETLAYKWGWCVNPHGKAVWFQLLAWPVT
ncbi:ATP-binding protein [Sphaerisporangium sp. TRM90804]|uniref:ATP-binding protein n=1 Tax=Sphaerisporangium sp. TRM90804 TaxID=3031113 RepID=UPI00244C1580|nr:ATP-binding protein [Sphaerisporangium sp. TRM90804]MDH2427062.1 ATP-binding protein [Sphaerisporangium sp. TRM90804]